MSDDFQNSDDDGNLFGEEIRHRQVSALVPEHIGRGVFSTGAIVTQGPHEFVVDFLLSMNRPHQLAARVILPPMVLAQVINALADNLRKYESRFGAADPSRGPVSDTPGDRAAAKLAAQADLKREVQAQLESGDANPKQAPTDDAPAQADENAGTTAQGAADEPADASPHAAPPADADQTRAEDTPPQTPQADLPQADAPANHEQGAEHADDAGQDDAPPIQSGITPIAPKQADDDGMWSDEDASQKRQQNRPSVQDVYDDLKIGDDVINGRYANAVMIGHSQGEFFFDFITNFFPRSAVSSRIYLSARQVPRLLDALKFSWKRYEARVAEARRKQQGGQDQTPGQDG